MRWLRLAHAWAGVGLCLVLAVLGLSGALLVFKADYLRATLAGAAAPHSADIATLAATLQTIEARYTDAGLRFVVLSSPEIALHQVGLADDASAFVDQVGAEVARWDRNGRFEAWLFDLHHHLLANEAGEIVAGFAGLCAALMIISGLFLWWPAARSFAWRLWPRSLKRRDLLAHHRDLGVLLSAPLLVFALTGAAMIFPDQARVVLSAATGSAAAPSSPRQEAGIGAVAWPAALASVAQAFPDAEIRLVIWPKAPGEPITIRLRQPQEWHPNGRTVVQIDPSASAIVHTVDAQGLPLGARAFNAVYPLHAVKVGGRLYDVLAAFTGFSLATLGVLGAFSYLRTIRRSGGRVEKTS
jgi:uncharacterized iron-regulated membrane protein